MSHKITGKEPLQKPCSCNTQDVLPSKLDIAIAEYKEMARKAEEARDEFLQKARALEDIAKETNATANKNAILAKFDDITIDTSTLAKEVQVKDGNDTAISVGKEVRSELGTGSDTAAETGTLFAVVKWVKDKVKSIYNALTDSTNGLAAIKTDTASAASDASAAKTAAQAITGYATEANATSNKNAIIEEIQANAGIQTLTIPDRNFPVGISWNGGSEPTIAADKTYEVSILNNLAAYFEI